MFKASEYDIDTIIEQLEDDEFGFLLVEADKHTHFEVLEANTTYEDKQLMVGKERSISYYLYPLHYQSKPVSESKVVKSRMNTIYIIFNKWKAAGYNKHHAKNPFACQTFMRFLDEIGLFGADYMLLMST